MLVIVGAYFACQGWAIQFFREQASFIVTSKETTLYCLILVCRFILPDLLRQFYPFDFNLCQWYLQGLGTHRQRFQLLVRETPSELEEAATEDFIVHEVT